MIRDLTQTMVAPQDAAMRAKQQTAQVIQHPTNMQAAFSPQGLQGALARGSNVYLGGLPNAPGAGRPRNPTPNFNDPANPAFQAALQRQLGAYTAETNAREARTARSGR